MSSSNEQPMPSRAKEELSLSLSQTLLVVPLVRNSPRRHCVSPSSPSRPKSLPADSCFLSSPLSSPSPAALSPRRRPSQSRSPASDAENPTAPAPTLLSPSPVVAPLSRAPLRTPQWNATSPACPRRPPLAGLWRKRSASSRTSLLAADAWLRLQRSVATSALGTFIRALPFLLVVAPLLAVRRQLPAQSTPQPRRRLSVSPSSGPGPVRDFRFRKLPLPAALSRRRPSLSRATTAADAEYPIAPPPTPLCLSKLRPRPRVRLPLSAASSARCPLSPSQRTSQLSMRRQLHLQHRR